MKSSVIYEKKTITIGDFVIFYKINLIWFCVLFVNLIFDYYFMSIIKNYIDTKICMNYYQETFSGVNSYQKTSYFINICENNLNLLFEKYECSIKILSIFVVINILHMIFKIYLDKLNNSDKLELFVISVYLSSSSIWKPAIYYIQRNGDKGNDLSLMFFPYFFSEVFSLFCFLFCFLAIVGIFCDFVIKFYNSNIKDIGFEYIDTKFVDIEKNT